MDIRSSTNDRQDAGPATVEVKRGQGVRVPEIRHLKNGRVAQLVEQRTENPRVGSSILPPATITSTFIFLVSSIASDLIQLNCRAVKLFGASMRLTPSGLA